jgi:hypothetical protein
MMDCLTESYDHMGGGTFDAQGNLTFEDKTLLILARAL